MRKFEVARKMKDGKYLTTWDEESKMPVVLRWDVDEDDMPEYATLHSAGADFRAVEDVVVKSLWIQLMKSGYLNSKNFIKSSVKNFIGGHDDKELMSEDEVKKLMAPTLVHTGIKACMEDDEVLYIYNRSSGPKKLGLVLANSVGVIDKDYYNNTDNDGEIMFAFYNFLPFDVKIKKGDKIGQGVFQKFLRPENAKIADRVRTGGIGSTDEITDKMADESTNEGLK